MTALHRTSALTLVGLTFLTLGGCANYPVTFYSENDRYFAGTNRHYTNGAKITVTDSIERPKLAQLSGNLDALGHWMRQLDPQPTQEKPVEFKLAYSLGQNIYTPTDIHATANQPDDRPYAAWLYGGIALLSQEADLLQTIELQLGVIGPAALGRQIQNGVHDLIGASHAEGWSHQLHNEPGFVLSYDWRYRWLRRPQPAPAAAHFSFDLLRRWGVSLGDVQTSVHGGPLFRAGWNIPDDFGPDLIRSGGGGETKTHGFSAFIFASGDARFVARDAFLDGNLFSHTSTVRKRPLVGDASIGLALYFGSRHFSVTQNYRTREFYQQKQSDIFGSFRFSILR